MAALLHQESRRLYSWWWDSHISPKNSKWLQENLTDMDAKVKAMIKLIEEDADSFARRAEMYYKKRPELMKLVEEFYRAYRALAERYNHATVELRHAHKTMSEAFPNQVPYSMSDDSSSQDSVEPHTPENSHPSRALLSPDELHALKRNKWYSEDSDSGISKRGLKQLREMFGSEGKMKKGENNEVENEVETLKKTLAEIEAEKEAILLQYQKTLQNFLERELSYAQKNANGLDDRASKADIEIKVLKEALVKLQGERDDGLLRYNNCLERIASLESMISRTHEDAKGLNERASKAEIEAQNLKQELSRLEAEKDDGLQQYKQCLEMISALENKIALAEENAKMLNETTERAESEVQSLKKALAKLREEKDAVAFRYEQCLEKMANMEKEMLQAQEDSKRLNDEIVMGNAKLKNVEQQCSLLESSHESLQAAAVDLSQKIAGKDKELFFKQKELEKLQSLLVDEHSQFVQAETTLQTLQKLHSQTQEEHKALTLELQSKLQTLKDLEICNLDLGEDLQKVKKENEKLHELNNLSTVSMKNLQSEIHGVREIKEKLEEEIARQAGKSNVLQQEVFILKEEITGLNRRYEALVKQVFAVGLNPEFLESSVKGLQDENTKLKEVCNNHRDERDALYEKLRNMDHILEKNTALEGLVLELNGKLGGSNQKVEDLKESCQFLREEKLSLVSEKATLLSQLQIMTENMQKLLEKNILLENSLAGANVELLGLRAKSKSLEEFCQMLKDEKSNLIHERGTLVAQLENIERRLGHLENRFTNLEEKYFDLEKEKESTLCQVEELRGTLNAEQQERVSYEHASESRLADLENNVNRLEEERRLTKKEFEEELDKAVNAQVEIFILQKFIEDLEDKNLSLLIECQKHVEASKLSDKVISELECENLEQQVEAELLLDEIAKLRTGIYKIFKALPLGPMVKWHEDEIEQGQSPIPRILNNIEDLKCSLSRNEEEKHKLVVENSVLLTLLQQLRLDGCEIQSEKRVLEEEFMIVREQHDMLKKDKNDLLEINKTMMLEMSDVGQQRDELKAKLEREGEKMVNLQGAYMESQEEKSKLLKENETLLKEFSGLKEQKCVLEEENSNIFKEAVDLSSLVSVLECVGMEKAEEAQELAKDLYGVRMVNNDLKKEVELLEEKLGTKEVEVLHLSETVEQLYEEVDRVNDLNVELDDQVLAREESLRQKTMELLEAEGMLKASHNLNAELCRNVDDLQQERKELKANKETLENRILEITEDCTRQEGEIEFLREENSNLECEVGKLSEEIEEQKIREVYLSSELQERSNEFELWESEASSFYFDLQISSVREVLLENKVQELTGACESLKDEGATKSLHIDEMKEKVGGLESEVGKLKVQLSSYVPVIASLRDHVASFEHNVLGEKNLRLAGTKNQVNPDSAQSNVVTDGISELHELQTRIREVERAVIEEIQRLTKRESIKPRRSNAEDMKSRSYPHDIKDDLGDNLKLQKSKPEISEVKNKTLMKDIPLDQVSGRSFSGRSKKETSRSSDRMLGLWEYIEQDGSPDPAISNAQNQLHRLKDSKFKNPSAELQVEKEVGVDKQEISRNKRETNKEESNRKILKRLASDAEKLASLKTTVEELKRKMGRSKGSKKANNPEYETVRSHLKEVEETVIQLVEINNRLTNGKSSAEFVDSENDLGEKVKEEVRKGSEKIGRLQIDVLSIQNVLMKLDDENKLKGGKDRLRSRTSVLLREFISGRNSGIRKKKVKKKKGLCGCVRPTTNTD